MSENKIICSVCLCSVMRTNAHLGNPWACIEKLKIEIEQKNQYIEHLVQLMKEFNDLILQKEK